MVKLLPTICSCTNFKLFFVSCSLLSVCILILCVKALCDKLRLKSLSPTPTPPPSPRMYNSLRGSYSSLSRESSPQSSPQHRGSSRNFRSSFNSDMSRSYMETNRNGFGNRSVAQRDEKPLKLPPWDQASAEFYFARSRDLLTKIMPQIPNPKDGRYVDYEIRNGTDLNGTSHRNGNDIHGLPHRNGNELHGPPHHYENWRSYDTDNRANSFQRLKMKAAEHCAAKNIKTNTNPSVFHKKEVPLNETSCLQLNNVVLRKCGSRGHLRRRSYNDRYPSSTSSDSSDSLNMSESDKQMHHRLKMRKQRRGGSFSHQVTQLKSPQFQLNSPPPQNSFLNSVTSPKNSPVSRNKFYFANLKPLTNEGNQHRSLNSLCKPNFLSLSGYEMKWPDRARDSSSLTFTSSNSSSLNWEEYPEFDRDFLSVSNCPPSPAPQV